MFTWQILIFLYLLFQLGQNTYNGMLMHCVCINFRCSKPSSRIGADFIERVLERRYASAMNSKQQRQQKPRDPIRANWYIACHQALISTFPVLDQSKHGDLLTYKSITFKTIISPIKNNGCPEPQSTYRLR